MRDPKRTAHSACAVRPWISCRPERAHAYIARPMKLLPSSRNCGENQSRLTLVLLPYTNKDIHVNDLLLVARLEERQEGSDHSVGADHIDVEQMC